MTGKRSTLARCLAKLEAGDTLMVWKLNNLSCNLRDLVRMLDDFRERGIKFRSLTEAINTEIPAGNAVWQLIGALAKLERSLLVERTRTGIVAARRRGVRFGRKPKMTPDRIEHARKLIAQGRTPAEAAQIMGFNRSTIYRSLQAAA